MSIFQAVRRRLVAMRDRLDGWLHPRRRRHSAARIQRIAPKSVLVVCLGNICRSPYAQWVMRERASGRLRVESAGFIGPDRAPPEEALSAARSRGIDHSVHRSKLVTAEMINDSDTVLVFERGHVRSLVGTPGARRDHVFLLGDFDPQWTGRRAILDPWGKPESEFDEIFERIDRAIEGLLEALPPGPTGRAG